ncbi:methyltransferase domain-containing protein [Seongchinamella sediminis]|uniref:Methyltransferase domain-containing protein n=1 Tax=Seongchinamella sediminis TaxID=2283635 RepID=A0A3L7DYY0_9GAMM|nr:class I SAM-dependent methyltransferase [Seongchinamella sediminis]RLQ21750.1 methyltransferase domain-containing protein [Seongchinamella sediminis]
MTQRAQDNSEQIEYWDGEAGQGWAERNAQMEKTLSPIGQAAIDAAAVQAGEAILDVGCGCADTSLALLQRTGPAGRVLGVDISGPMLEVAGQKKQQLDADLQSALSFQQADASNHRFDAGAYDLMFSRFGVMFFADPAAAFANIRRALKPGGRLAFICWAPIPGNDWVTVPMGAALQHLPKPEPLPPHAPGPFGLADREFVERMLTGAGFADINIDPFKPTLRFGHGMAREQIGDFFIDAGPASRLLREAPPERVATAREAIREAVMPFYDGETVNLAGSCWIVTARNH